ncbi:MOSC N-terminal beta barrel domain-containing protein [Undibacterium sp. 14-3-2]|uniref:MOSC domain-containing protein n=1 Tax=Undibacterium sp. 14-3-2 TaxID=2800129 RepID=UPI001905AE7B|nr:MOSC N-terminal beta barrel domain-containing protein [Undibacterium sp. 14-3-2]MBK1890090.1 MOSC N-terminal beta barrel domain-containing protein [Undibacterium sp. 14-3-2]
MPSISELTMYPIKSCAGITLTEAVMTASGLSYAGVFDREWMLVDGSGLFLTQREYPRMACLRITIAGDTLRVDTDTMATLSISLKANANAQKITVQIWETEVIADDAGEEAAIWFSQALGTRCRLVRFSPQAQRYANTKWTGDTLAPTRFADGYPLLLIAQASLEDLNRRAIAQGRQAVPMNRFRPNIVIDGVEAFEEDYAASYLLQNGVQLRPVKPCPRCPIPAVDQLTGEVGASPVDILQSYRANPIVDGEITFGMNVILEQGAGLVLRIGDEVEMPIAF